MKILLGISRTLVDERGTRQCQRSDDEFEIEVPDDGSEFLSHVWMVAGGEEVLRLPLTIGPAMTSIMERMVSP